MLKKYALTAVLVCLITSVSFSQKPGVIYSRADTLRGTLSDLRSSYDIHYYHLNITLDIENKFISGSNLFKFKATTDLKRIQFDLFANLQIQKVSYHGQELPFKREFNAVFLDFPATIKKDTQD